MSRFEVSAAEEISQLRMEKPHIVLLGAGASRAAFPNGEANGKRLPLMADFAEIVPLADVLRHEGIGFERRNFEELYSELCTAPRLAAVREQVERVVFNYFSDLALPSEPTLYDHLVLSLQPKDVIATFNWDPFLIQAVRRTTVVQGENHPHICFLHGNVAAGYCAVDEVLGVRGGRCSQCRKVFEACKLLYPVSTKRYDDDPAISSAWRDVKVALRNAFMVTVFGYSAPTSDVSAVELLLQAWGGAQTRSMEEFEIIDIRPEEELRSVWDQFIHTHHYEVYTTVYDSWLFNHPRRTGEAYWNQFVEALIVENNPLPRDASFDKLRTWFRPLLERERGAGDAKHDLHRPGC